MFESSLEASHVKLQKAKPSLSHKKNLGRSGGAEDFPSFTHSLLLKR